MEITWRIINLKWINQLGENIEFEKNVYSWILELGALWQ